MPWQEIVGLVFVGIAMFFAAVGVLGTIRLPDVYSRLHASGKVATLSVLSLLVGVTFLRPDLGLKALVLGAALLLASATGPQAIAAAAVRQGVPRVQTLRDDLPASASPTPEDDKI